MPTGLIFDLDGTLVTFTFDVKGTKAAMIAELSSMGFDTAEVSVASSTLQILDAAKSQIPEGDGGARYSRVKERLYSILDESELRTSPSAEVIQGTREALERLKKGSVRLAVLTNSGRKPAIEVLRRSGLLDLFEFVLTRDDIGTLKPDPEGMEKAISMLRLPRDEVWYVGDGLMDIIAAKRAGLRVVSVPTGVFTFDKLKQEGADYVIGSLNELPGLLTLPGLTRNPTSVSRFPPENAL